MARVVGDVPIGVGDVPRAHRIAFAIRLTLRERRYRNSQHGRRGQSHKKNLRSHLVSPWSLNS
jgi:hypothetical protein